MKITYRGRGRYEFRAGRGMEAKGDFSEGGTGRITDALPPKSGLKYSPAANIANVDWILRRLPKKWLILFLAEARKMKGKPISSAALVKTMKKAKSKPK